MKAPLSWLKEFVEIDAGLEEIARLLTAVGLEVDEIRVVGLPMPAGEKREFKITGLAWEPDKIVVARIDEVMPHPNADRLVLCRLFDGQIEHTVLTGAPSLLAYKDKGPLSPPLYVAYAKEGARIYDGHAPGLELVTLKRAKIRGVESYSMVCSEKELGISEEHEDIIYFEEDAPVGMPLVDYIGDAVYDISITPNQARNANIIGMARELAAVTGKKLRMPEFRLPAAGAPIKDAVSLKISDAKMNPRFVLGLVRGVKDVQSRYKIRHRLRLAGMRPLNAVVDATNYAMLELGQPLHAFDYDLLAARAGGKAPTIITRMAEKGEKLVTLDNVEHTLDHFTILVADTKGALSLAGVMGGLESEVTEKTTNVLLEGATWNTINTSMTVSAQHLQSEAAYRLSRGVHPEIALLGVKAGLQYIADWAGGEIASGLIDEYPLPAVDPEITLTPQQVKRQLGIAIPAQQIASLLERLEFVCRVEGDQVHVKTPPIRLDIGEGDVGQADVIEEIARMYGYDNFPYARLSDELPVQRNNPLQEGIEWLQNTFSGLGMQEIISYRLTTPEAEDRLVPAGQANGHEDYVRLQNPISSERVVMRRSLLACVIEAAERNIRQSERLALYEVGPVFLPRSGEKLPFEAMRAAFVLTGKRHLSSWKHGSSDVMDFYDMKGVLEAGLGTRLDNLVFEPERQNPVFHPGKCARILCDGQLLGVFGELHPLVKENYSLSNAPLLAAELDVDVIFSVLPKRHTVTAVSVFPPVLEDIAVVVDENVSASQIMDTIRRAGGKTLSDVRLFDVYRGSQIGEKKKSLAFSLTYQAYDRTLTDDDAGKIRQRIINSLEKELGARLRS